MERSEAERAASEARHRLANVQQLLSALARLRSQRAETPEIARQLLWMADAVSLLGLLERRREGELVDFPVFLGEMAPVWRRRHPARAVEIVLDLEPLSTPDSMASTLALITQELVVNAITHAAAAGPCTITIGLHRHGERYELTVSDDGPGLGPVPAPERFGLWLVRSLATQVRGEFDISSGHGVTARLSFPV